MGRRKKIVIPEETKLEDVLPVTTESQDKTVASVSFKLLSSGSVEISYDWNDDKDVKLAKDMGSLLYMINRGYFFKMNITHLTTEIPEHKRTFVAALIAELYDLVNLEESSKESLEDEPLVDPTEVFGKQSQYAGEADDERI